MYGTYPEFSTSGPSLPSMRRRSGYDTHDKATESSEGKRAVYYPLLPSNQ
jgi:hypothetical protein